MRAPRKRGMGLKARVRAAMRIRVTMKGRSDEGSVSVRAGQLGNRRSGQLGRSLPLRQLSARMFGTVHLVFRRRSRQGQLAGRALGCGDVARRSSRVFPRCGSQLYYQSEKWADETHLYAATLTDSAEFQPKAHFHWAEKVPWLHIANELPKYAGTADGATPIS